MRQGEVLKLIVGLGFVQPHVSFTPASHINEPRGHANASVLQGFAIFVILIAFSQPIPKYREVCFTANCRQTGQTNLRPGMGSVVDAELRICGPGWI